MGGKENGLFLEEYFKFRLEDTATLDEVTIFPALPWHLFETQTTNAVFVTKISQRFNWNLNSI